MTTNNSDARRQDPVESLSQAERDELLLNTRRPTSGPDRAAWNAAYERTLRRIAQGEDGGEAPMSNEITEQDLATDGEDQTAAEAAAEDEADDVADA